jgi:hypothetical protein
MRRIVMGGLGAGLVAMSLGVSGCSGGGGIGEGMPADVGSLPKPAIMDSKMGPPPKPVHGKVGGRIIGWKSNSHA